MDKPSAEFIFACRLDELVVDGMRVVHGGPTPLLLVHDRDRVFALDNRCPHMGFPLHQGSVEDGILTCHWHHARFDLSSGCTFDLWADDVPRAEVDIRGGEIWVSATAARAGETGRWRRRLLDGMARNISLVMGKAILDALDRGVSAREIIREAALFGVKNRDGWDVGMTILTALGNVIEDLPERETYLALFQGVRRVAADCAGEPPYLSSGPLEDADIPEAQLEDWLRKWTRVRHRTGAQRTVETALAAGMASARLTAMMAVATTDRAFADGGHSLDFINKALECLDLIGWDHAGSVVPTAVGHMVQARGSEESDSWRYPVDLVALVDETAERLPALFEQGEAAGDFDNHARLAEGLLSETPEAVLDAVCSAVADGAAPVDLSRALAYAAALRVARFGTANEFSDWDSAHHVFTYCNALHQVLKRIAANGGGASPPDAVRGVLHGAMALYLRRYLNVPPAALPGEEGRPLDGLPAAADDLLDQLLGSFDRQAQVDVSAQLVARYLGLGHDPGKLITALAFALLREDAGFHTYQMFEAGVRQFREWGPSDEGRHILIAVTRFMAAHFPTERSRFQTAYVAERLHRGGALYEGEGEEPG